jgi:hypothetical protein
LSGFLLFELIGLSALRFNLDRQLGIGARFWLTVALTAAACLFLWLCAVTLFKRRGWFTLREFLIGVLLIGTVCGIVGKAYQRTLNQRRVAALLTKRGAQVFWGSGGTPGFEQLIGREYFHGVQSVSFTNVSASVEEMALLRDLPELHWLSINSRQFTDEHLSCLDKVASLKSLTLHGGQFSGAALKPLRGHPNLNEISLSFPLEDDACTILPTIPQLRSLVLFGSPTSSATIAAIGQCKQLESLTLFYPRRTAAAFAPLAGLPRLRVLSISGDPSATAAGLEPIGRIATLETLTLYGSWVNDEAMAHLSQLPNLANLTLYNTSLTDAGVGQIERLENLKILRLQGNAVTTARIVQLRQNHPKLEISQ